MFTTDTTSNDGILFPPLFFRPVFSGDPMKTRREVCIIVPDGPGEVSVEIGEIRKRIDLLDDVLLRIFNERARLALEIGRWKKKEGLPVYDPAREKRIFARMKGDNPGPLDDGAIVRLFERVVDESRRLERIKSQGEGPEKC